MRLRTALQEMAGESHQSQCFGKGGRGRGGKNARLEPVQLLLDLPLSFLFLLVVLVNHRIKKVDLVLVQCAELVLCAQREGSATGG